MKSPILSLVLTASLSVAAQAAVSIVGVNSTTTDSMAGNPYAGDISTADLINAGQTETLSSATSSAAVFAASGINDGASTNLATTGNTFYTDFPATATFNLNVNTNTLGYDINSIQSLMGWATVASEQANQIYTVAVSTVGSAVYATIATVNYTPFSGDSTGSYDTKVTITEGGDATNVLASGVDSIRFTFANPGGATIGGTLVREIDVLGVATTAPVPEPSSTALLGLGGLALVIRRRR